MPNPPTRMTTPRATPANPTTTPAGPWVAEVDPAAGAGTTTTGLRAAEANRAATAMTGPPAANTRPTTAPTGRTQAANTRPTALASRTRAANARPAAVPAGRGCPPPGDAVIDPAPRWVAGGRVPRARVPRGDEGMELW